VPETLQTYLAATRRLLHDANADYWSDADLILDINSAVKQRDLWSGGSRSYQSNIPLTAGQDQYQLPSLFPALAAKTILDVISVWLIYGATRVQLDNPSFDDLQRRFRPWNTFVNRPAAFARYGAQGLFIAPAPSTPYTIDADLVVLSVTLANLTDADPLPFPYTEPIPYWAAYYAKINSRRYDEADVHLGYAQKAIRDIEGARVGEMQMAYSRIGLGRWS